MSLDEFVNSPAWLVKVPYFVYFGFIIREYSGVR